MTTQISSVMSTLQKSIVITGCTKGLGRALVDRFLEAGWLVAGCGRSASLIEQMQHLSDAGFFRQVDTKDAAAVEAFAAEVLLAHGTPHMLVNNAAVINANAPLWEVPVEEFAHTMRVNLDGVFHGIRSFVPHMISQGSGYIVNLSSGWGRSVSADVAPYCATKWGVEGLSQALALDLPAGLACVALNPGVIDTDMLRSCYGEAAENYPDAEKWSHIAIRFLTQLRPSDNGRSLSVG
jgi:NAD(P)-dependent dehydrogenase (short-subunit alcohol dehydrogenase family)